MLNAFANILLKLAAIGDKGTTILALATNPLAIAGVAIFASNIYFYIQALRIFPVSIVYPVLVSTGFLIINSFGILYLKESFTGWTFAGYAAIIIGIGLVTYSYR